MEMARQNRVIDPCPDLDRNPPVGELGFRASEA